MAYRSDTLCGIFHNQALRFGDQLEFLRAKLDKDGNPSSQWHSRTWKETRDEAIALAKGLTVLGLKKVIVLSSFRKADHDGSLLIRLFKPAQP